MYQARLVGTIEECSYNTAMAISDFSWLPKAFLAKLQLLYPDQRVLESVLQSFTQPKPISVRFNPLASFDRQTVLTELKNLGCTITILPWYQDAWVLEACDPAALEQTKAWLAGALYRQNLSSMVPPLVLNPGINAQVLDLAAAPGSKTTQMAALMQNTGLIFANDLSRDRMFKLKSNVERLKVTNVTTQLGMGQNLWKHFPQAFEKALADVPCSMEGRITKTELKSYDHWSEKQCKTLAERQVWLLRSAISATEPGGYVLYSTCTLSPEEDELVLQQVLKKSREKINLLPITLFENLGAQNGTTVPYFSNGLTQWKDKELHPDIKNSLRIQPSQWYEGFFVALLKIT